jgi:hypothetical protein
MATARTLMIERTGRCSRLAKISLFIPDDGSERLKIAYSGSPIAIPRKHIRCVAFSLTGAPSDRSLSLGWK